MEVVVSKKMLGFFMCVILSIFINFNQCLSMKELIKNYNKINLEMCTTLTDMGNEDTEKALKSYMPDDLANRLKENLDAAFLSPVVIKQILNDVYVLISAIYKLYNKYVDNDILPKSESLKLLLNDRKIHEIYAKFLTSYISVFNAAKPSLIVGFDSKDYSMMIKTVWPFYSKLWDYPGIYIEIKYFGKTFGILRSLNSLNDEGNQVISLNNKAYNWIKA